MVQQVASGPHSFDSALHARVRVLNHWCLLLLIFVKFGVIVRDNVASDPITVYCFEKALYFKTV